MGASHARSPLAIRPVTSSNANVLTKMVDAPTATAGDTLTYEVSLNNDVMTDEITVTDMLPAGTTYVDGSATESVTGGETTSPWAYDAGSNSMSWSGYLEPGLMDVFAAPITDYVSLASLGVDPFGFPGNCDDGAWGVNIPSFTYNGESYSSVIFSVNGTIEAGQESGVATSYANQNLPDPTTPNNIIAPFWRDLNGCDGGELYVAVLSSGPFTWTVFEWEDIPHYGASDAATFQVWLLADGSPQGIAPPAHFTYGRLDNVNDGATVGAENASGTIGKSYFYNGEGTAPEVGTDLAVISLPGGNATLGFQVTTDCSTSSVVNQADAGDGERGASAIAVTACQ